MSPRVREKQSLFPYGFLMQEPRLSAFSARKYSSLRHISSGRPASRRRASPCRAFLTPAGCGSSYSPQMILMRISVSTAMSTGLAILAPFDIASPVPM